MKRQQLLVQLLMQVNLSLDHLEASFTFVQVFHSYSDYLVSYFLKASHSLAVLLHFDSPL